MSNLSQFGGGGGPVGTQVLLAESGPSLTLADNSVWLRSGTLTTPASAPQLAAISYYQVLGTYVTTPIPSTVTILQVASNGTGTLVATLGGTATNIYRSTDYGANWSSVTVAANIYPQGVAYGGGRFVLLCQTVNNTSPYTYYSTTAGASWTAGITNFAYVGVTAPNSLRIVYTGTTFVCCGNGYNTSNTAYGLFIATTTDGTTVATNNGGYSSTPLDALGGTQQTFNIINSGATVIIYASAPNYNYSLYGHLVYSLNSGSTWTTISTFSSTYYSNLAFNGAKLILFNGQKQIIWSDFGAAPATYTTNSDSVFNPGNQYQSSPVQLFTIGSVTFARSTINGNLMRLSTDFKSIAASKQLLFNGTVFAGSDYCISTDGQVLYDTNMTTYNYCGLPSVKQLMTAGYYTGYYMYVRAS